MDLHKKAEEMAKKTRDAIDSQSPAIKRELKKHGPKVAMTALTLAKRSRRATLTGGPLALAGMAYLYRKEIKAAGKIAHAVVQEIKNPTPPDKPEKTGPTS